MWTKEDILSLAITERPEIRCRIEENGVKHDLNGVIIPEGNNVWCVCLKDGKTFEYKVSWGLLLQVLNDNTQSPISMGKVKRVHTPKMER